MRLMWKIILMAVLLCGGLNYAAYLSTGRSLFSISLEKVWAMTANLGQNAADALGSLKADAPEVETSQVIYKWTNEEGVLQYSNAPPPAGTPAQIVKPDPDANLILAVPVPESAPEPAHVTTGSGDGEKPVADAGEPFPYSPEQIKKTVEDARDAQRIMNERLQQQQQILENL